MWTQNKYLLFVLLYVKIVIATNNNSIGKQEWGHIAVRPGAHMFWWLYHTTANATHYTDRPLIIWLQGGPGLGSSCLGNFVEIGPLDVNLKERNYSWTQEFNVLFLDNPVDVGMSYTSSPNVTTPGSTEEVADDLVRFLKKFLEKFPMFEEVPIYVFGESYGGKFAAEFSFKLHQEIGSGRIKANLDGVGIMSGFISPMDYLNSYGQIGLAMGLWDNTKYKKYNELKRSIKLAAKEKNHEKSSYLMRKILTDLYQGYDIYNIIEKTTVHSYNLSAGTLKDLSNCNRLYTNIIQPQMRMTNDGNWSYINVNVNDKLRGDYLVSVTDRIEYLLDNTDVKVMVFSGMFDLITNVKGTISWMNKLRWASAAKWRKATQNMIQIDGVNEAYGRKADKLMLYIVAQTGHAIPVGNPKAMLEILRREILQDNHV